MDDFLHLRPVGHMKSVFHYKNGTPRQPSVCAHARGSITIDRGLFNNPEHSLEGLEQFSHVWIMFLFHKNNNVHTKAKVKPPRLNGKKVGVFSTRSPYRPNAIGLTLATIECIQDATIYLKGIDILDGTPILDIKPYIPDYDDPGIPVQSVRSGDYGPSSPEKWSEDTADVKYSCPDPGEASPDDFSGSDRGPPQSDCQTAVSEKVISPSDYQTTLSGKPPSVASGSPDCQTVVSEKVVNRSDCQTDSSGKEAGLATGSPDCQTVVSGNVATRSGCRTSVSGKVASVVSRSHQYDSQTTGNYAVPEKKKTSKNAASTSHEVLSMSELTKSLSCNDSQPDATLDGEDTFSDPRSSNSRTKSEISNSGDTKNVQTANWITNSTVKKLDVRFTATALEQLEKFSLSSSNADYKLCMFSDVSEVQSAIQEVLNEDPRSVYRRTKCKDSLYYFAIDTVHVTCWFDDCLAEVVRIQPVSFVAQCSKQK